VTQQVTVRPVQADEVAAGLGRPASGVSEALDDLDIASRSSVHV
jgi:hypothetical protein